MTRAIIDTNLEWATAFAPATVGNVAVGFDILGHALIGLGDRVTVRRIEESAVRIKSIVGNDEELPTDPRKNTATAGLVRLIEDLELDFGFEVEVEKGIPLGSGMGGSAASAVAGIVAASALLERHLSLPERFRYAMIGEEVASGGVHGDNIAPCLMGGLILVRCVDPVDVVRIPVPHILRCVLVHPHMRIDTREARGVIKAEVSIKDFVTQSSNLAGFIAACCGDDRALLKRCLKDVVIEPQRASLIPGFDAVKAAALSRGALGCSISGAGPSVFAWCDLDVDPEALRDAMISAFKEVDLAADGWVSTINGLGAHLVERGPNRTL
ncbi:MAG: homoserine kinase [Bradymonadaceae bacterium]